MSTQRKDSSQVMTLTLPREVYRRVEAEAVRQGAEVEEVALASLLKGLSEDELPRAVLDRNPLLRLPAVDLGMTDGSAEHDHYIYGTPKRGKREEKGLRNG